jgi:hypothetical protein
LNALDLPEPQLDNLSAGWVSCECRAKVKTRGICHNMTTNKILLHTVPKTKQKIEILTRSLNYRIRSENLVEVKVKGAMEGFYMLYLLTQ